MDIRLVDEIEFFVGNFDAECELNLSEYTKGIVRDAIIGWVDEYPEKGMVADADPVNNPTHYKNGGIETIELIKEYLTPEEFRGYLKGNIIKYRERAPYKGNAEQDYAKALKYWEWLKGD